MKKRIISTLMCLVFLFPLTLSGCGITLQAEDLMSGVKPNVVDSKIDITGKDSTAITDFGLDLFRQSRKDSISGNENTLISPLSVIYALTMTANGAKGDTLAQMEEVLGLPTDELNGYLHSFMDNLPSDKKYKLNIANSIWFKDNDSFTVEQDFLQMNADLYGAGLFKTPFNNSTRKDINAWVEDNTDGMMSHGRTRGAADKASLARDGALPAGYKS